jgi:NAD(P)-dependent dehydrogenase (short-subunit alcohol dehydrogenase family)
VGRLNGKVAIVTGGAMGIGRGTATLFAHEGAKVVVADLDEVAGAAVVEEIRSAQGEAILVKLDVCDEDDWKRCIKQTVATYGKLNVLVNNAGVTVAHDVEETTLDEWNRVMAVNATGVFLGMKHAIAAMKASGEACSIINRSSVAGQIGEAALFPYCASKGAVTIMTKSAALAVGEKGYRIRVNSVHPGYVRTPMTEMEAGDFGLTPEEYFARIGAQHPIGFVGEPLDVAYLDVYLASDESRWVTGAEFTIDGGYTAR